MVLKAIDYKDRLTENGVAVERVLDARKEV